MVNATTIGFLCGSPVGLLFGSFVGSCASIDRRLREAGAVDSCVTLKTKTVCELVCPELPERTETETRTETK